MLIGIQRRRENVEVRCSVEKLERKVKTRAKPEELSGRSEVGGRGKRNVVSWVKECAGYVHMTDVLHWSRVSRRPWQGATIWLPVASALAAPGNSLLLKSSVHWFDSLPASLTGNWCSFGKPFSSSSGSCLYNFSCEDEETWCLARSHSYSVAQLTFKASSTSIQNLYVLYYASQLLWMHLIRKALDVSVNKALLG